jgi:2-keto-3-deoxy-L-rhamnonate aldolase RhmA
VYPQSNRVTSGLSDGAVVLGSLTLLQEPAIGEILGGLGYDFLIIDMEHAGADEQTVLTMVRACEAANVTPLVRLRRVDEKELLWALDTGAGGVVLPMIETPEDARAIFRLSHYPPIGDRTLCSAARSAAHGTQRHDFGRYLEWSNDSVATVCLIETPLGLDNVEAIVAEGIHVLMLGRGDLSVKMGLGYAPNHPLVLEAARDFVRRVAAAGGVAGVLAYSSADALEWIDLGARFIVYSQPEMVLSDAYRAARDEIVGARQVETRQPVTSSHGER